MKSKLTDMNLQSIFSVLLLIFVATCILAGNSMASDTRQVTQQNDGADDFIGFVKMEADGTLILQLYAYVDDNDKTKGHALSYFRYPPGHPEYEEVLRHVDPIKPGESKPVRPWPETSGVRR